jgi:hypothetical protein
MRSTDFASQTTTPRLPLIFVMVGMLVGAFFIGTAIGQGQFTQVYLLVIAGAAFTTILKLGSRYWLLIPFSLSFTAPVIPLGNRAVELPELAIVVCAVLFVVRLSLKAQKLHLFRADHVPFLLYTAWAALICFRHPIGFVVFGASSGGARFYLKIFLAFAAFLIIANQKITNRDCKWILTATVIGTALDLAKILFFYYVFGGSEMFQDPLENYSWQQQLSTVPLVIVLILFSRYRSTEIWNLSETWKLLLLLVCVPIILVSGKRAAVVSLGLYPLVAAVFRKEFRYAFMWAGAAAVAGAFLVLGHGTLFHLPLNAQRSLSWLPGRWDSRLDYMEGGQDIFRAKLRDLARERIRQNPWIGAGYDVNMQDSQRLMLTMGDKFNATIISGALSSQWHNKWLGYAADFGIPASVLLAVIYIFVISRARWALPRLPDGSLLQTMVMFISISTVADLAFSHTGGHSATDAFNRWWMYGVLVSIGYAIKNQNTRSTTAPDARMRDQLAPTIAARARLHSIGK